MATSSTPSSTTFLPALDESTQAFFDDWLATLTTFPPGDPNDTSVGTSRFPATSVAAISPSAPPQSTTIAAHRGPIQVSDDLIDPGLLGMQPELSTSANSALSSASCSAGEASHNGSTSAVSLDIGAAGANAGGHAASPTNLQPPTPSLVDSPSITVTSLADTADRDGDAGPATPSWDWSISDSQEMEAGMKLLHELSAMDVDTAMDLSMNGWEDALRHPTVSALESQPGLPPATPNSDAHGSLADLHGHSAGGDVQAEEQGKTPTIQGETFAPQDGHPDPQASQPAPSSQTPAIPAQHVSMASGSAAVALQGAPLPCIAHTEVHRAAAVLPQLPAHATAVQPTPAPAAAAARTARGKGKAKAIPGTGNGVGLGTGSGKQDRRAVLERARAMRAALAREVERAKVALWETTLEQGVLVGLGRELEKGVAMGNGKGKEVRRG
ncbi:hypothetical protein BC628DRAFT_23956 [Trametes gibbosa]|nr:hypothetical protein BC628DRAFT_23956 [Trametes gibbosa]